MDSPPIALSPAQPLTVDARTAEPADPTVRQQALRMKRFLMASTTYALGIVILALCTALGLFPATRLAIAAAAFALVNVVLYAILRSGWNRRLADPSMTAVQMCVAVTVVSLILVLGDQIHFIAVPYYSVLFIFGMLQLTPRALGGVAAYVVATYCGSMLIRTLVFDSALDLRVEAVYAVMVVASAVWFSVAAGYISRLRGRLRESVHTIEQLAIRDGLTDTWNRRHLDTLLQSEMLRSTRQHGSLCVCMVDVDHFKAINDQHGHLAGDAVLKAIAACMKVQLRAVDELGRFGGEEFLVLLPGATLSQGHVCAERLRTSVAALAVLAGTDARVTVSIGLAQFIEGESAAAVIERVDQAMYRAKGEGRNRVVRDDAAT